MSEKPTAALAVKIQARAVIPIVRALEREIGKNRVHSIVGQAIAESYAEWQGKAVSTRNSHPRDVKVNIEEQLPIETEVVEDTDSTFAINMTRCRFAEYFRTIGAADVGALLTCGVDFAAEAVLRPDWEFRRTQTLMGGASHCDFRWRLRDSAERGRESFAQ
jgi:hypothetical protein